MEHSEYGRGRKLTASDLYRMADATQDAERERILRQLAHGWEEAERAVAADHQVEPARNRYLPPAVIQ